MSPARIMLAEPKHAHNVASALRACAIFGADSLFWTGGRVPAPEAWPEGARLPREERMKLYRTVEFKHLQDPLTAMRAIAGWRVSPTPVAVELRPNSESLIDFEHPDHALYVFGPEDGSLPRSVLAGCHRFLRIPACFDMENVPLNLAAAVNIVLYDRLAKEAAYALL